MSDTQHLKEKLDAWKEQAAQGQLSYADLEQRLRRTGEALDEEFANANLTVDAYLMRRDLLTFTDIADRTWRYSTGGAWRYETSEGTWERGEPELEKARATPLWRRVAARLGLGDRAIVWIM